MTGAGADILVAHMGLTTSGTIGARTALTLDDCAVARFRQMRDAAVAINLEVMVLCHGGPIAEPDDAAYVLGRTLGGGRLLRRNLGPNDCPPSGPSRPRSKLSKPSVYIDPLRPGIDQDDACPPPEDARLGWQSGGCRRPTARPPDHGRVEMPRCHP